ncbi:hypothetical protein K227x_15160 [Rubripirellula lacrimiformis]|uniref:Uncharacterized protein n=1 Tax=Rubripirellula lacrimiformis TaxID=1930273 RepID=A0A517N7L5_9BACT|nr:hypothetical protein [Rubripirellula lacrimiformis]QDT03135.1 hypothetical protein K227x_15160 [Rubripirellula lacrimiformis]
MKPNTYLLTAQRFSPSPLRALIAITAIVGLSLSASAQDMAPELGEEPASPMAGMFSGLNPANWTMPNFKEMLPGQQEKARIVEKKDGLFTEVKQTATRSWTKTKEIFNPQKLNPVNYLPASSKTPSSSTEETKPGFFRSLFMPAEPVAEPTPTVQDFLKQSRPS